ncbi:phage tail family protein [Streptomyces sp. ME02-8801-2C]|uniref:phage tail domain-containing protein n=1 Tax=Streptomyces sp. ME02-8801-2C TaxID=3028680 RepID=UPI0029AC8FB0|nr:phage tail domain-containing protein [Streptomyces sp. ME02-8801-2C]MDX3455036.1 phage tail family protein [Streptomyces sp. ME02-8801-2C]
MPLIAAPVTTPPDPGGGGGTPVPLPEIGYATATYTDPSGTVWPLTDRDADWFTLADGVSGLGAVPYELTSDQHPRGGARLRHAQAQPRTIVWPLFVQGATHMEFTQRWRALATAFTRTLREGEGPGVLEIARPDGSRRQIEVFYQEGFEGQAKAGYYRDADSAVLSLWCEDPYWTDPFTLTVHRETGTASTFFDPYPTVSSSQILGSTTVNNPGDTVVWPTWVVTGPASLIEFTHAGTGESFTLDPDAAAIGHGNLLAGEKVTISTEPPQVRYQNGDNWIGGLDWPTATLWGLAPGDNEVTFALSGSGPGSSVDLAFNPRYETA